MKTKLILIWLIIMCINLVFASKYSTDTTDKDYFRTARFNEVPENVVFEQSFSLEKSLTTEFFVIYTDKLVDGGTYIKFSYNANGKLSDVSYSTKNTSKEVVSKLKRFGLNAITNNLVEMSQELSNTGCAEICDRKQKCYDKPTDAGVLACAMNCLVSCT